MFFNANLGLDDPFLHLIDRTTEAYFKINLTVHIKSLGVITLFLEATQLKQTHLLVRYFTMLYVKHNFTLSSKLTLVFI